MISAIIPSYRNPKCLDICINSAIVNAHEQQEIIVIIDGFKEESQHIIDKYKGKVTFIILDTNAGMQHALNMGVYAATSEWVLIVNDDNVFPKDWDKTFLESTYGKLPASNCSVCITPNQIERTPSIFNFITYDFGTPDGFSLVHFNAIEPTYRQNRSEGNTGEIFPFFISKKNYMAVGGFDTVYDSPFVCDWDFFLKLELSGVFFCRMLGLNFYHFGSMATKNGNESDRFNAGEMNAAETFKYKWGFYPIRNEDNTHRPKGSIINGIAYEN